MMIFISHRTTDAAFADMIRDFLVGIGVHGDLIFCSSLPGNDVKEKISLEVKENLRNSCLNIVILSKSYYESAYCLNEAGILWYNDTKVLPIALDDIDPSDMIGFLNDDYKIRRLNNYDDIAYIADLLKDVGVLQGVKNATIIAQGTKLKTKYENTPQVSVSTPKTPKLNLYGIKADGKIDDEANYHNLRIHSDKSADFLLEKIKKLYEDIKKIQIDAIAPIMKGFCIDTPIKVDDNMKTVIQDVANELGIEMINDFFFVGNLSKPFASISLPFTKPTYNGTDDEITKYNLIEELYLTIIEFLDWSSVEDGFKTIKCVELCLCNNGVEPDEDIDVILRIPQDVYMNIEDLPEFSENTMEYIVNKCNLSELLGIPSTAEYACYDSTIKKAQYLQGSSCSTNPLSGPDYEEEYLNDITDAISYEIFTDEDNYIIKLNFEYLKHNTIAAFPAPIMLKEKPGSIPYEIRSKGSKEVIKGVIKVNE